MDIQHRPNRLAQETSPYLLQHQFNPVDWYAWNDEAFTRAKAENKPILLSVGYSACHWCHVMERESFENEEIAAIMNQHYVCIKVDREERPDVDAIYMGAVQMMTGQGGWPMTVFLTPEGKPFYGGTYYPPVDMYGRPGFPRILEAVAEAWKNKQVEIVLQGDDIAGALETDLAANLTDVMLTPKILDSAFDTLAKNFDPQYGGFGSAPKFPQPSNLDFLLRYHARSKRQEPLAMVEKTLQKMALGGIYDQLGGGFHRYSTDQEWLAPHFEKMLYDNAQLAQTYAHAYQITGKAFYKDIAVETLEYIEREMTAQTGGFYSAQDADSEGEEGKFFVWKPDEIRAILGERNAAIFSAFYDVTEEGNWEGSSILRVVADVNQLSPRFKFLPEEIGAIIDAARTKLFAEREKRVKPGLDDKVLTAWNGLMLAAFAECGAIFGEPRFLTIAQANADFLLRNHTTGENSVRLLRTSRGGEAKLNGYLEDYAFFTDGLIHLYQATLEPRYLEAAIKFTQTMVDQFWDESSGGFFATSVDHETLIQRPKDWDDNAVPAGNTVACEVLLKIAAYTGITDYTKRVERVLRRLGSVLEKHPTGFARMLGVLDTHMSGITEIALISGEEAGKFWSLQLWSLHQTAFTSYVPNKLIGHASMGETNLMIAFLRDRPAIDGKSTAYVCRNFACSLPVTTPDELEKLLRVNSG